MCIPGDYWKKQGVQKECGNFTIGEIHEAYQAAYANHIKDGKWTVEQFVEWFPRGRAQMTHDQVREFAEAIK